MAEEANRLAKTVPGREVPILEGAGGEGGMGT